MQKYIRLLRPHHCVKNLILLFPVIFSYRLTDLAVLWAAAKGFLVFSSVSFAVYIFNDICDIRHDRLHPRKKQRPLAAGAVTKKAAVILFAAFTCTGFGLHFVFFKADIAAGVVLSVYFAANLLYSLWLKNIPAADILIVASGYLLRLVYGSRITAIPLSVWLCLTLLAGALYLVFGKRACEKEHDGGTNTRRVLQYYSAGFLKGGMVLFLVLTVLLYLGWAFTSPTIRPQDNKAVWAMVPLAPIILLRYHYNIRTKAESNPVDILFSDKILLLLIVVFSVLNIVIFLS